MKVINFIAIAFFSVVLFSSCSNDKEIEVPITTALSSLPLASQNGLYGKVKEVTTEYYKSTWDAKGDSVIIGVHDSRSIEKYDQSGVKTEAMNYRYMDDNSIRLLISTLLTYDAAKYRRTGELDRSYRYKDGTVQKYDSVSVTKISITYDDANRKATELDSTSTNEGVTPYHIVKKRIYVLKDDGSIDTGNYEDYLPKTKSADDNLYLYGTTTTRVLKKDEKGNWLKGYLYSIYYQPTGAVSYSKGYSYGERTITYY